MPQSVPDLHLNCAVQRKRTKTYTLRCEMISGRPLAETFAVFEDPYNLAKITPPWLKFRVTSPERVQMWQGAEIQYVIRWLNVPIRWNTRITQYDPPQKFVDEQEQGPYTLWRHQHTFEETSAGTKVKDEVHYTLPFGFLGRLVHAVVVRRQLLAIFRYRQTELGKIFGAGARQLVAATITT
jgi:ligand-binding SRPBCC domain-containing protein